ncbi:MAG: hypothetical protein N4A32_09790 [Marinifilaceae bacterium]|nr:hypothetical protein [Marinifilaceae bacterium]
MQKKVKNQKKESNANKNKFNSKIGSFNDSLGVGIYNRLKEYYKKEDRIKFTIRFIIILILLIIIAILSPLRYLLLTMCIMVGSASFWINFYMVYLWLDIGKEIFRRDIRKWWALMFLINIAFLIFSFCISAIEVMMTVFGIINILFIVPYTLYVLIKKLIKKRF